MWPGRVCDGWIDLIPVVHAAGPVTEHLSQHGQDIVPRAISCVPEMSAKELATRPWRIQ